MNPKRAKYFYKPVADKLEVEEELVKDAVEMYWHEIRKSITELKHHAIYVKGLGTFLAKSWKVAEVREGYEKRIEANTASSFVKMTIKAELELRVKRLKLLEENIQKDKDRKQSIKDKRNDKADLEKQVVNPGGDASHNIQEGSSGEDLHQENEDM